MTWIIVLVLAGVAGFALFQYSKSKKKRAAMGPGSGGGGLKVGKKRYPLGLNIGAVLTYYGQDFIVEGIIECFEEGDTWYEFMLVDGKDVRWLCVEEDVRLELSIFEEVDEPHFTSAPPEFVEHAGVRYRLDEKGAAQASITGETGRKTSKRYRYWDYEGPSGELLSVEQWGGSYEVSLGKTVGQHELDILNPED